MTTRRRWHISALAAAALIVAGCGGGSTDAPLASRVVVFGDSLSDIGAYTPASQIPQGQAAGVPPFFGGKFTTNSHTGYTAASNSSNANIWVEWIAARLGVALTPHEVGFGPQSVKCPAIATSPSLADSCTGYAQGGSRVTNPAGIGNPNGTGIVVVGGVPSPVPMTRPMTTQVADHLTRFTGFSNDDIVFVFGGNNDVFIQFGAVGQGLGVDVATTNIETAATELANLVKNQIIANGAGRVAVMTLPDAATAPGFSGLAAPQKAVLSGLSAAFNTKLLAELAGTSVRVIDVRALNAVVQASPASFGLTNTTAAACDPAKVALLTQNRITDGSSLFCNASALPAPAPLPFINTLKTGASASTWLFADGVHPTTGGHKILADQVLTKLKEFGWVPENL